MQYIFLDWNVTKLNCFCHRLYVNIQRRKHRAKPEKATTGISKYPYGFNISEKCKFPENINVQIVKQRILCFTRPDSSLVGILITVGVVTVIFAIS